MLVSLARPVKLQGLSPLFGCHSKQFLANQIVLVASSELNGNKFEVSLPITDCMMNEPTTTSLRPIHTHAIYSIYSIGQRINQNKEYTWLTNNQFKRSEHNDFDCFLCRFIFIVANHLNSYQIIYSQGKLWIFFVVLFFDFSLVFDLCFENLFKQNNFLDPYATLTAQGHPRRST